MRGRVERKGAAARGGGPHAETPLKPTKATTMLLPAAAAMAAAAEARPRRGRVEAMLARVAGATTDLMLARVGGATTDLVVGANDFNEIFADTLSISDCSGHLPREQK
ncbi:hypothetical protein T492DRAFT_887418 [Pavlovales sp. CCMP2436]|nr:hypothetical protein T492DRAFT_887418 [Pavlovales sp. CCMP2436]